MIRFKKPIGFEDYLNGRTVPMGVYDKAGELEYIIKPSHEYKNSGMEYVDISDIIPKKIIFYIYIYRLHRVIYLYICGALGFFFLI